jgi:pimeloyl-ACP methyl ester carboxylesterase
MTTVATGAVAAAGYRVLLPDRRWLGGGTTAPVSEHTWALEGDDLAAMLRHAGAAPALVVAASNACPAALRLALDQPELVAGLVLAWPPLREDPWLRGAFERSAAFVASAGTQAYLDALRRQGVPGWREQRPGLAFGVALTLDPLARESFERLEAAQAAALLRGPGRPAMPAVPPVSRPRRPPPPAHQRRRGRTNLVSTKTQNRSGSSGKNPR